MVLPHGRNLTLSGLATPDTALKFEMNGAQQTCAVMPRENGKRTLRRCPPVALTR